MTKCQTVHEIVSQTTWVSSLMSIQMCNWVEGKSWRNVLVELAMAIKFRSFLNSYTFPSFVYNFNPSLLRFSARYQNKCLYTCESQWLQIAFKNCSASPSPRIQPTMAPPSQSQQNHHLTTRLPKSSLLVLESQPMMSHNGYDQKLNAKLGSQHFALPRLECQLPKRRAMQHYTRELAHTYITSPTRIGRT